MWQIQRPQLGWACTALWLLLLAAVVVASPLGARDAAGAASLAGADTLVLELGGPEGAADGPRLGASESPPLRIDSARLTVAAMPVPGTACLLVSGLMAIAAKRRTQRRE
jgi:hypothetical protein